MAASTKTQIPAAAPEPTPAAKLAVAIADTIGTTRTPELREVLFEAAVDGLVIPSNGTVTLKKDGATIRTAATKWALDWTGCPMAWAMDKAVSAFRIAHAQRWRDGHDADSPGSPVVPDECAVRVRDYTVRTTSAVDAATAVESELRAKLAAGDTDGAAAIVARYQAIIDGRADTASSG